MREREICRERGGSVQGCVGSARPRAPPTKRRGKLLLDVGAVGGEGKRNRAKAKELDSGGYVRAQTRRSGRGRLRHGKVDGTPAEKE